MGEPAWFAHTLDSVVSTAMTIEEVFSSRLSTRLKIQFVDRKLCSPRRENLKVDVNGLKTKVMIDVQEQALQMTIFLLLLIGRTTVDEIPSQVGIIYESVQSIITDQLGFRKMSARWVLKIAN